MILYDLKVELVYVYVDNNGRQTEYKRGNPCKLMTEIP